MLHFLWGATSMGAWTAALFFLRFWRQTRDRFFLAFALAFMLLAVNWLGLVFVAPETEARTWMYLVRLAAFVIILLAIWDKNRSEGA